MRTIGFNVIIKINKQQQWEHRNKIGSLYIPSDLMAFNRNLQFAEIVAFGKDAVKVNPEIGIGKIAIYHHMVEDTADTKSQTRERFLEEDDTYEYRYLISSKNHIENELFAVYSDDLLYVSEGILLCSPDVKKSGLHKISDNLWDIDDDVKTKLQDEELEVLQHAKKELSAGIRSVPLNDETQALHEQTTQQLNEISRKISDIQKKKNRVIFSELTVMYSTYDEYPPGAIICVDSPKLYPLIFDGITFALVRSPYLIYARREKNGDYTPAKEFCIVKPDDANKSYGNIHVPEIAQYTPNFGVITHVGGPSNEFPTDLQVGNHVNFNSKKSMKIYMDGVLYYIMHYFDLFYEGNQQEIKRTLSGMVLIQHTKKEVRKIIHMNEQSKNTNTIGIVVKCPDNEKLLFSEFDRVIFNLKFAIPYDKEKGLMLIHKHHIVSDVTIKG